MLGRAVNLVFLSILCFLGGGLADADDGSGRCSRAASDTGQCTRIIDLESTQGPVGKELPNALEGGSRGVTERTCAHKGRVVQCNTARGSWSSYASSWCRSAPVQPALDDPIWEGETTGSIYECTRPGFDGLPNPGETVLRWLPAPPEAAAAPDPEDLARRLLASIDFEAPELGMFPRGDSPERMSYVGWRMWLWAESSSSLQWGPVSDSLSQGGVTVSLTARVSGVEWNMGDGKSVSCGKGTPWSEAVTGGRNVASPDCGHVYSEDGRYTVTVTSSWDVEWSGGGRSGSLPFTLSREADVLVGELQSVNRDA